MAILDIFKKRKSVKTPQKRVVKRVRQAAKPSVLAEKPKKEVPSSTPLKPKKVSEMAYRVLKRPHVTEKATDLTKINQYVFEVYADTNKPEIKKVIEDIYGVDVVALRIVNIPRKKRKLGKTEGWKAGYKKVIARIKEGQKIEILPR